MIVVITYIFSCSLLMSYIKPKPVKLVESINDVLNNSEIGIAGQFSIKKLSHKIIDYQTMRALMERAWKYEGKMNLGQITTYPYYNFLTLDILKDMINGKGIVLVDSYMRKAMQDLYNEFNLVTASEKYSQNFEAYYVFKNIKFSAQIANL